ncbi:hypothetical protein RUM8411_04337 [Ruegeria meonggei]|uniref:Uncharacterized protein n=1 Tax=Ruegeria meonggei TaxID=1446476 RepID=A0A1X7ACB2_9RHOB|nr:hypothetical protein RUM8411_04337 [Ruegeria meonggei]
MNGNTVDVTIVDHVAFDQDVVVNDVRVAEVFSVTTHPDGLCIVTIAHVKHVVADSDIVASASIGALDLDHIAMIPGSGCAAEIMNVVVFDQDVVDTVEHKTIRPNGVDIASGDADAI